MDVDEHLTIFSRICSFVKIVEFVLILLFISNCSPLYYFLFQPPTSEKEPLGSQLILTYLLLPKSVSYPWGTFTDNRDGTVLFVGNAGTFGGEVYAATNLIFAKCSSGQTWQSGSNTCSPEIPSELNYCNGNDDSCNDTLVLNGDGNSQAYAYCDGLEVGGRTDWRVPTKNELKLLIACTNDKTNLPLDGATGCGFTAFQHQNADLFPNAPNFCSFYWSASRRDISLAYYVNFCLGTTLFQGKGALEAIRCVSNP